MVSVNNSVIKAPKWIIILGSVLFVVGIVIQILFPHLFNKIGESDPISSFLSSFPILFLYLYTVIVAPVLEELGFRGWQVDSRKFKVLSYIIVAMYVVSTLGYLVGMPLVLVHAAIIFFKFNNNRRIWGILYSSLIFSIIHFSNYASLNSQIIAGVSIFGLGLVMSYITWRFSLLWSIIFHAIYNGLIITITLFYTSELSIKTKDYDLVAIQQSRIKQIEYSFGRDSIMVNADLNTTLNNWIEYLEDSEVYFYLNSKNTPKINLSIKMSENADQRQIIDTLVKSYGYVLDTVPLHKHMLTMPQGIDTVAVMLDDSKDFLYERLEYIVNVLKYNYNIPIYYNEADKDRIIKINVIIINDLTSAHLIKALDDAGIKIEEDTNSNLQGIKLKYKNGN